MNQLKRLFSGRSRQSGTRHMPRPGSSQLRSCGLGFQSLEERRLLAADVELTKIDLLDPVSTDSTFAYQLVLVNHGPDSAIGVELVDLLPDEVEFVSATSTKGDVTHDAQVVSLETLNLGPDEEVTVDITVNVVGIEQSTTITNIAQAFYPDAETDDPNLENNVASETTDIVLSADIQIDKTNTAGGSVYVGATFDYQLVVTNNGPDRATNVVVQDFLPDEVEFVEASSTKGEVSHNDGTVTSEPIGLDNTETVTINITVRVKDVPDGTTITNTAEANSSTTSDPDTENNSASDSTDTSVAADIQITKIDVADEPVKEGSTLVYQLVVYNNGPSNAESVVVKDYLPDEVEFIADESSSSKGELSHDAGVVTLETIDLASTEEVTIDIAVRVKDIDEDTTVTNTAEAFSDETFDPNTENNTASASTDLDSGCFIEDWFELAADGGSLNELQDLVHEQEGNAMNAWQECVREAPVRPSALRTMFAGLIR